MAVIEYDEYKQKLQALEPTLRELEKALGIPKDRQELKNLQAETEQEGFWNNIEHSQKVSQQIKRLEHRIKKYDRLVSEWEDTVTLCEMAQEEDDASLLPEVTGGYENLEKEISERRLAALLSGEYDANNAILTFHAGAGGTEAQDWTEMLYRMYTRWAERHGYTYQLMDYEAGDEAGIKSATILIEGDNAYGYLKSENGVHRLVRVSPFDANARRQTSFASVEVMPDLPEDVEIEVVGELDALRDDVLAGTDGLTTDVTDNSDLRSLELQEEVLRRSLKAANAGRMPTLAAFGSASYTGNDMEPFNFGGAAATDDSRYFWTHPISVGLQLSVPIFSGLTKMNRSRELKNQISQLSLQRSYARQQIDVQVRSALNDLLTARETMYAQELTVEQARKAYKISDTRYRAGAGTILELNSAQLSQTQAQLNFSQAIYDYLSAKAEYDRIVGREHGNK